jgi:hypothetical protein
MAQHGCMRIIPIAVAALLATTAPALAQFPPPGVYLCVDMAGAPFGTLSLFAAGAYEFKAADGIGGSGQVASSGNSVDAVSGPLADIDLSGSFTTDAAGASFTFTTLQGSVFCALPQP